MMLNEYLAKIFQFLALVPAAALFFLPMKNQLRYRPLRLFVMTVSVFAVSSVICAWIALRLGLTLSSFLFPLLPVFFFLYHKTVRTDLARSLCVFFTVCALLSFPSNFAYAYDAWLYPSGRAADFSCRASLFYFGFSLALALLVAYPLARFGSRLIERLNIPQVWFTFLPVPVCFLIFNILLIPHKYETLHTNNVFPIYLAILGFMMLLLIFICVLFYRIAVVLLENADDKEKLRFFEVQESQYLSQKRYIEQTEKLRHDFRQSIRTLERLSAAEDWEALKNYLAGYSHTLPSNEITAWCPNPAVNALLNYYSHSARQNQISLHWKIALPELLSIPEPDFCSLLGNLLENAISGCMTKNPEERSHRLTIAVHNEVNLYIVSVNTFDGQVKKKESRYLSTKQRHQGTGLSSIAMTAEKYGGVSRFSHTETEFSAEIMMHLPK